VVGKDASAINSDGWASLPLSIERPMHRRVWPARPGHHLVALSANEAGGGSTSRESQRPRGTGPGYDKAARDGLGGERCHVRATALATDVVKGCSADSIC
jgi:hypothetical protein